MQMDTFPSLVRYCNWNWPERVRSLLCDPTLDVTRSENLCFRLAVRRKAPEVLDALLSHLVSYQYAPARVARLLETFTICLSECEFTPTMWSIMHARVPMMTVDFLLHEERMDLAKKHLCDAYVESWM